MRGRRPTPTLLKKLHGVEPRRINHVEPEPRHGLPEPPAHLTAEQRAVWKQVVQSAPPGLLSPADAAMIETWTIAWSLHRKAAVELERIGSLTVPSASDPARQMPSPLITIIAKMSQIMARVVSELGFSPTTRSRVVQSNRVPYQGKPTTRTGPTLSLEDFLAKGERLQKKIEAELVKKH